MGVEVVVYIEDLDPLWPLSGDPLSESDNHHRLIKDAIQGSFPSLGANAVSATALELNLIDGSIAGTAVASKALVLGATKDIDTIDITLGGLKIGTVAVTATAAELNSVKEVVRGTFTKSAVASGANVSQNIITGFGSDDYDFSLQVSNSQKTGDSQAIAIKGASALVDRFVQCEINKDNTAWAGYGSTATLGTTAVTAQNNNVSTADIKIEWTATKR